MSASMAEATAPPSRSSVLSGGLWSAASQIVPALGTAVLSVAAGRLLGSGPLGQQSVIAYLNSALSSIIVVSLNTALLQAGGALRGRGDQTRFTVLTRWSVGAHLAGGAVVLAVMATLGELTRHNTLAWIVVGLVAILDAATDGLAVRLVLIEGWGPIGRLRLVFQAIGPVLGIGFLFAGFGIVGIFLGDGVAALGLLFAVLPRYRRTAAVDSRPRPAPRPSPQPTSGARLRLRPPTPVARIFVLFAISAVITQVVTKRVEFVVLAAYSGDVAVGMYSVAFVSVSLLSMIPLGLATAAMPLIAAAEGGSNLAPAIRHLHMALRVGTAVTLPLVGLLAALGPAAVTLVYGPAYRTASLLVPFASSALLVSVVVGLCTQFWSGRGRLRIVLVSGVAAGVVDLGLALALVPAFGPTGATAANVAGQLTLAAALLRATARELGPTGWRLRSLTAAVVTAGVAAAAALLLGLAVDIAVPAGIEVRSLLIVLVGGVGGLSAAGIAAMVVRPFDADEVDWLTSMLPAAVGAPLHRMARPSPMPVTDAVT